MVNQRFGRPTGVRHLTVRVGAPLGHWVEGRAKPRAVRLTSRDTAVQGIGGKDTCPGTTGRPSTSQGAGLHLDHVEEELLDYEEEEEVHEVAVQTGGAVERPKVNKRAAQGDRLVVHHRDLVAENLLRDESCGLYTVSPDVTCKRKGGMREEEDLSSAGKCGLHMPSEEADQSLRLATPVFLARVGHICCEFLKR
ncbi:hypothetical protein NDU88_006657 [Pleurodeles waltl]|uniref:Uncharacterized protein n=1 Tax=Pleurodeles waltl TaxID=8319 RepID=A0AAV7UNN6_PLEWA|nr:hypothetical protein NDU88_006657 [Pleurodeles waltl]